MDAHWAPLGSAAKRCWVLFGLLWAAQAAGQTPGRSESAAAKDSLIDRLPRFTRLAAPSDTAPPYSAVAPGKHTGDRAVTVLTPFSLIALTPFDSLQARVRQCAVSLLSARSHGASPAQLTQAAAIDLPHPWAALDSATADRGFVMIQIDAPATPAAACEVARDPALLMAGVQLAGHGARSNLRGAVRAATVTVGGRVIQPRVVISTSAAALDVEAQRVTGTPASLRLYFAPGDLGPDAHGRFTDAGLHVTAENPERRDSLVVSDSILSRAWRDYTRTRIAAIDDSGRFDVPHLQVPTRGRYVRAGAIYDRGDVLGAAALAAAVRHEAELMGSRQARGVFPSLLIGSVLLAHGDSAAGRAEYAQALDDLSCLRFGEHPAFDRVLAEARPETARCGRLGRSDLLTAGLLRPGGAQRLQGNRVGASRLMRTTAALLVAGLGFEIESHREFNRYMETRPPADIGLLYDRANTKRAYARTAALSALGVWLGSAAYSLISEVRHSREVRRQEQYEETAAAGGTRP
jgi:hypothetical protein